MNRILTVCTALLFGCFQGYSQKGIVPDSIGCFQGYYPTKGFVPDSTTAIKIAEAIWLPIYGNKIYKELPFHATLVGDSVWVVQGSLDNKSRWDTVRGQETLTITSGGVLNAEIRKTDCKVMRVFHSK